MTEIILPTLYRGDTIPSVNSKPDTLRGRSFAGHFTTDGLLAKVADGGLSQHLELPLEELVQVHIGYGNIVEEKYKAYHSPLISFTDREDEAFRYMNRSNKSLIECPLDDATYFLWRLHAAKVREIGPGCFEFRYSMSIKNVEQYASPFNSLMEDSELFKKIAVHIVHDELRNVQSEHLAQIINSITYLKALPSSKIQDETLYDRALDRAIKSSEWLVYPMDPMPDGGQGYSNRFQLNDHLFMHKFFNKST